MNSKDNLILDPSQNEGLVQQEIWCRLRCTKLLFRSNVQKKIAHHRVVQKIKKKRNGGKKMKRDKYQKTI